MRIGTIRARKVCFNSTAGVNWLKGKGSQFTAAQHPARPVLQQAQLVVGSAVWEFISFRYVSPRSIYNLLAMKFLGGFITGVLATILVLFIIYAASSSNEEGLKSDESVPGLLIFPDKAECITKRELKVFQTIRQNMALAQFGEFPEETLVLLINHEGKSYYDKQKILIPKGKCARQIGTYQYETRMEIQKTVPVVIIE